MNQRGFATLEVILMVMVIGILASIAVPRFTSVTAAANTAKIQSDLSTINTAIEVYHMEKGDYATSIDALVTAEYLQSKPKPASGSAYIEDGTNSKETKISNTADYNLTTDYKQATFDSKTIDKFYMPKKTTTPASSG